MSGARKWGVNGARERSGTREKGEWCEREGCEWAGERSISGAKDWERVCGARERGEWGERKRGLSRAREREGCEWGN